MAVVKVPKTPKSSFNKNRPPSALLLDQIKHLEWAALPASQRKPHQLTKYKKVRTEAQAAERIAQLTTIILEAKEAAGTGPSQHGITTPVVLPPLPRVPTSPKARKVKRATRNIKTTRRSTARRGKRR